MSGPDVTEHARPRAADRARREYTLALLATAVGAAALLAATSQTWARGQITLPGPVAPAPVELAAGQVSPTAAAMGWVSLAAVAALVATRGWTRRAAGLLVAVFGAVAVIDVWRGTRPGHLVRLAERQATAAGEAGGLAPDPVWPWVALAAGLLLTAAGLFAVVRGPAWPAMSSRYDRHSAARTDRSDHPADLWKSLDSGADPTADPAPDPGVPGSPAPGSGTTSDDNAHLKER
ncbi:Trp biosynthesis-associated membrane protein [Marinactinospora rubrisoli]|uniref:Trp biosynthesis-associated membrane protein n=1 Tax=Marinactinospora rubrisoli TaxID=2715399 RepID=A0ABW2KEJ1_9ACTN